MSGAAPTIPVHTALNHLHTDGERLHAWIGGIKHLRGVFWTQNEMEQRVHWWLTRLRLIARCPLCSEL